MTHGIPVVCSSATCLPEIVGDAAVYIDPHNIEHMADSIHSVLCNDNIRYMLQKNSKALLKQYSWQQCVDKTLGVYASGMTQHLS